MSTNARHPGLEQHRRDVAGLAVTIALPDDRRRSSIRPEVRGFFDPRPSSVQYVVSGSAAQRCAIIDPVLDFEQKSGSTATRSASSILLNMLPIELPSERTPSYHPPTD